MHKEMQKDGTVVIQEKMEVKIPLKLTMLLRFLRLPWIISFIALSVLGLKIAEFIVMIRYGSSPGQLSYLVIANPMMLLFGMAMGSFCYFIYSKLHAMAFGHVLFIIAATASIWSAQRDASNIYDMYNAILISECFIEGYILQWWTNFAPYRAEELYMREVDRQAKEFIEKKMMPEAEKLYQEQKDL